MKTTLITSFDGLSLIVNTGATATSIPETMSYDVKDEPVLSHSVEEMNQTKVGLKKIIKNSHFVQIEKNFHRSSFFDVAF